MVMADLIPKPPDLFDRDREWNDLVRFATDPAPGVAVALVYGGRRQGKSYLLRRLAQAYGGFYHQALEIEPAQALAELGEKLGAHLGVGPLALDDWGSAIGSLATLARTKIAGYGTAPYGGAAYGGGAREVPGLAILDEFPYHLAKKASLPSLIQRAVDNSHDSGPPVRLILCGSAMSVMEGLLEGPLRGRIKTHVLVRPFDHREFTAFWGIDDPVTAFRVHATVGGTPGYKDLVRSVPRRLGDFDKWVTSEILSPSSALFNEDEFLLGEERSLGDRSLYHSVLAAIADGHSSRRPATSAAAAVSRRSSSDSAVASANSVSHSARAVTSGSSAPRVSAPASAPPIASPRSSRPVAR